MTALKREKVKSAPFSNFMRNASAEEKNEFFAKIVQDATEEQRQMIAKAQSMTSEMR